MSHIVRSLRGLVLSGEELKSLTSWPDAMIEDYLNVIDNLITLADESDSSSTVADDLAQHVESLSAAISKLRSSQKVGDGRLNDHIAGIFGKHPASDVLFDDSVVDGGFTEVQSVLDFFDDQIGLRETAATGVVSGGNITIATPTTIDIALGSGEVVDGYTDRKNPTRIIVSWSATLGLAIPMPDNIGINVVIVDALGNVSINIGGITPIQRRTVVQLAFVYYKNGAIDTVLQAGILSNEVGNTLYDWIFFTSVEKRTRGLGISPVTGQLQIYGDSGDILSPGANVTSSLTDPNIVPFLAIGNPTTPAPFDVLFADGSTYLSAQTNIPKFYESAPGVATALTGTSAVIHYIYRSLGNSLLLQLGDSSYADGKLARDSLEGNRTTFVQFTNSNVTLLSSQVYADRNSSDFTNPNKAGIVSLIGAGSGASGVVSVSQFLGLSDVLETTYTGNKGKLFVVDDAETGVVFTEDIQQQQAAW